MQSFVFFGNFARNKLEIDKLLTVHRGQFMHNFIQSDSSNLAFIDIHDGSFAGGAIYRICEHPHRLPTDSIIAHQIIQVNQCAIVYRRKMQKGLALLERNSLLCGLANLFEVEFAVIYNNVSYCSMDRTDIEVVASGDKQISKGVDQCHRVFCFRVLIDQYCQILLQFFIWLER
jgi:hypothetical protein